MSMTPMAAANAYASAARVLNPAAPAPAPSGGPEPQGDFSSLVQTAIEGTADAGQSLEAKVGGLAEGRADVVDLVTAVAETELAVDTLVAVRDRVIAAYQDILNMPI